MDDLLKEFLTETAENIAVLDLEIVKLEQNPNDPALLSNIFRLVHTIKGTCGFLGLPRLEAVAHAGENVLGRFRDGDLVVTPGAVSMILQALDRLKFILAGLEADGVEPPGDDQALIDTLNAAAEGNLPDAVAPQAECAAPPAERVASEPADVAAADIAQPHASRPDAAPPADPVLSPVVAAAAPAATAGSNGGVPQDSAVAAQSIRVNVDVIENLMTTVSELVLTRNQLLQIARTQKDSDFAAPLQRLNQVVSELQEGVMKTRMQPIGNAWSKLPRIIRDLSHELGKKIELEMYGAETELDRQVLELIKDPLTHMVRNSADHGIERPVDRRKAGKAETGRIRLNAFHRGGYIIIEIADDGRGLAIEKIKAKAVANGLATEAELAGLSDLQIQQFIFRAGFSTAEAVTSVSGRGVGMDVVRTNIERIGGTIELKSVPGAGSTFTIKIPLTLAIVSGLIVEAAGERYAVPQISVVELVRAREGGSGENRIERIKGTPVFRLRDKLLPLVVLEELLKLERPEDETPPEERFIVVTQVGAQAFGIIVDRVFDTEEIVVKPVAPVVRHIAMFSGNTILGDGSVIMILDPNGIAGAVGDVGLSDTAALSDAKQQAGDVADTTTLLVFRAGDGGLKAVPLSLVARLEEFEPKDIELVRGQQVIQYRGKLVPLIPFQSDQALRTEARQPALVFADEDRVMGLLIDEIVDIVETRVDIQLASATEGILGSAIVGGKATDMIDAGHFLTLAFPDWFGSESGDALDAQQGKKLLLVDDSPFFRNMLRPLLQMAGYRVTTVAAATEALALCQSGEQFDVIVSDIEMPDMSGFDFAARLKSDERWRDTPVLALSAHVHPTDLDRARASGFDDYVAKFDRAALIAKLSRSVSETRRAA